MDTLFKVARLTWEYRIEKCDHSPVLKYIHILSLSLSLTLYAIAAEQLK